jgi:hypothetical protein
MFQGPLVIADETAHASSQPHVSYVAMAPNDLQRTQDMQRQAWCNSSAHDAAAAVGSMDANLVAARNSASDVLGAIPSVEWLMLQQHREQHMQTLDTPRSGVTAAISAAIAAAAGGASHALAIPDSLLDPPANYMLQQQQEQHIQRLTAPGSGIAAAFSAAMAAAAGGAFDAPAIPASLIGARASYMQQQPLREVPEYIPVVAPAVMPSTFHPPTQHVAAAVTRAAAVCRATWEVLLDLHPDAFVLVAGSLDLVEKLSGVVLRIVECGQMPLGLQVLGRQEEVVVACELIRSLAGC